MKSFNIKILGAAETHWNNSVEDTFQQNGYVIIHSARKDEIRRQGVAIVIEKELSKCMTSYALTSERIVSVTLKRNTGSVSIIQVYTPDSNYDDNEVENILTTYCSKRLILFQQINCSSYWRFQC